MRGPGLGRRDDDVIRLFQQLGVRQPVPVAGDEELRDPHPGEVLGAVQKSGLGVIVGPFDVDTPKRELDSVAALGTARVPLAFGLDAPAHHDDALRLSAALCVRAGLEPALAWKGLTSDGAAIAGVGSRVGSLEAGMDADFVLWSGHPLELTSSVVEVYVSGARVVGGAR